MKLPMSKNAHIAPLSGKTALDRSKQTWNKITTGDDPEH